MFLRDGTCFEESDNPEVIIFFAKPDVLSGLFTLAGFDEARFDVSARPYVPEDVLSFATPMKKFETMINNMEESFLTTESWQKVKNRIGKDRGG